MGLVINYSWCNSTNNFGGYCLYLGKKKGLTILQIMRYGTTPPPEEGATDDEFY